MKPNGAEVVERLWSAFEARDWDTAEDLLHHDFELEWPHTGEAIRGRANFMAMNRAFPGDWHLRIIRVAADGDTVASEVEATIGEETEYAASFFELRDGKIVRVREYWITPGYQERPGWREQWVEPSPAPSDAS